MAKSVFWGLFLLFKVGIAEEISKMNVEDSFNPNHTSKNRYGVLVQPLKYYVAYGSKAPYINAEFIIESAKTINLKASWLKIHSESGRNEDAQPANVDDIHLYRIGISITFPHKREGFSVFHEPGINIIDWHWRNSEFLRFKNNSFTYEEDREKYSFIGIQFMEYFGIQWRFQNMVLTLSPGIGINLGINEYRMIGVAREPEYFSTPIPLFNSRLLSGDLKFGIGWIF